MAAGADANVDNKWCAESISGHVRNGNTEAVKLLITIGADVNARDEEGRTPLNVAAMRRGGAEVVKLLVASGADVNKEDHYGRTQLSIAARTGKTDVVKFLVVAGADVNTKDGNGNKPLDLVDCFRENLIRILKAAGAKGKCRK